MCSSDLVIGEGQSSGVRILTNVDTTTELQIPTTSPENGIIGILYQFTNGRIHSAVQRRSHDLNDTSNIHSKRDLTTPHAMYPANSDVLNKTAAAANCEVYPPDS